MGRSSPTHKPKPNAHIVALAIHGGAGGTTTPSMPPDLIAAYRNRLSTILNHTYFRSHTSSLDAVCDAVTQLEDSPLFNAGKGAVFDLAGNTVCESSIMTTQPGFNSRCVAVTGVRRTKNPILLSKVLLEKNEEVGGHAFYSGPSAEEVGWKHGLERVSKRYYWTQRRWNEHKRGADTKRNDFACELDDDLPAYTDHAGEKEEKEIQHEDQAIFDRYAHLTDFLPQGTVGAVALDSNGHLSVATSTGGKTNKFPGRIGDTPSVGSGFWASTFPRSPPSSKLARFFRNLLSPTSTQKGIAISGTGDGDFFLRTNFASSLANRIEYAGDRFDKAIESSMTELVQLYGKQKGVGGAIVLNHLGNAYFPIAASTMNRGLISRHTGFKAKVAIFDNEDLA